MSFFDLIAMSSTLTHSLKPFNTLGLAQYCANILEVHSTEQLIDVCLDLAVRREPMLVLGGGSNLVLIDDFRGTVVRVMSLGVEVEQDESSYHLSVAAGESWHELIEFCLAQGMPGLENMALIPGTVGAAPIQNIGAYGIELCDVCAWVEYLDLHSGKLVRLSNAECEFSYRDSIFKGRLRERAVITRVGLCLPKLWRPNLSYGPLQEFDANSVTARDIFDTVCQIRRQKLPDPAVLGNAGSFFKNPMIDADEYLMLAQRFPNIVGYAQADGRVKLAAGWLIDTAGLKGYVLGHVAVHQQQALVLVNLGGGTGQEICQLALYVIEQVKRKFGVVLEPEPRIIGATGETHLHV
jgi:UDP-N-acetylmuramate dehydrogenase